MTPAELKRHVTATGSFFFTRKSMRFFGDTMKNYTVRKKPRLIDTVSGDPVECWVLVRRKAVKHGLCDDAYFDIHTFERGHQRMREAVNGSDMTFSEWLAAAGREDTTSQYDLRAAWRAGENPTEYRVSK